MSATIFWPNVCAFFRVHVPCPALRWPIANARLPAVSVTVPPRWNVTNELKGGPSGALVWQSRRVTCTVHVPMRLALESLFLDWAVPVSLNATSRKAARQNLANTLHGPKFSHCIKIPPIGHLALFRIAENIGGGRYDRS